MPISELERFTGIIVACCLSGLSLSLFQDLFNLEFNVIFPMAHGFLIAATSHQFKAYKIDNTLSFICFVGRLVILKDLYIMVKNK